MYTDIDERTIKIGLYIAEKKTTVRAAAKHFGVSKSTVHKDLSHRLPVLSKTLYKSVSEILDNNKRERHIRGGNATKEKYVRLHKKAI